VLEHILARPSALEELRLVIAATVADAAVDGLDAVRAEVDVAGDTGRSDALAASGFADHYVITRRAVRATAPDPACLASDNGLRSFAVRCLTDAVVAGLTTGPFVPPSIDRQAVEDFVSNRMALWDGRTALSYVAVADDGDAAAHADVRLRPARHSRETEGLLNDVYVLPEARGRGWAQRLTAHVESELHARGVCRVEGTVVLQHGATPPGLVRRLSDAGWWIDRRSMVLPVTPPVRAGGSES
jgi:GNAT superfamily N-acetyltransferase